MKIYTSYYGNLKNLLNNNILPIVVSTSHPNIPQLKYICKDLAPGWDIINNYKNDKDGGLDPTIKYEKDYITKLDKLSDKDWFRIYDYCKGAYETTNSNGIALMCYDKPVDFCHRHILRNYINRRFLKWIAPDNLLKGGVTEFSIYQTAKKLF